MRWSLMLAAADGLVGSKSNAQGMLIPEPSPRCVGPALTRIVRTSSAARATLPDTSARMDCGYKIGMRRIGIQGIRRRTSRYSTRCRSCAPRLR